MIGNAEALNCGKPIQLEETIVQLYHFCYIDH